ASVLAVQLSHDAVQAPAELGHEQRRDLGLVRLESRPNERHRLPALGAVLELAGDLGGRARGAAAGRVPLVPHPDRVELALLAASQAATLDHDVLLEQASRDVAAVDVRRVDDGLQALLLVALDHLRGLLERRAHRAAALADQLSWQAVERLHDRLEALNPEG